MLIIAFGNRPYYISLVVMVIGFVIITSLITIASAAIPIFFKFSIDDPKSRDYFLGQVLTTMHLKNVLFWAVVVAITHFTVQVIDKFGPGNLRKIIYNLSSIN